MPLIDEKGRLFGRVNVVDALVIALLLAVVLSIPVALQTLQTGEPSVLTQHAIVELDGLSQSEIDDLVANETYPLTEKQGNLTVYDVYWASSGRPTAIISGELTLRNGYAVEIPGQFSVVVNGSVVEGTIRGRFTERRPLETKMVPIRVEFSRSSPLDVEAGQRVMVRDRLVATLESVTVVPGRSPRTYRYQVGATVSAVRIGDAWYYGAHRLTEHGNVSIGIGSSTIRGEIVNVGSTAPRGTPVTTTFEVVWTNVHPAIASSIREGMKETHLGATARVVDVTVEPTAVTAPNRTVNRKDVTLTVVARTYREGNRLYFHDRPLYLGTNVTLDFGTAIVNGKVVSIRTHESALP